MINKKNGDFAIVTLMKKIEPEYVNSRRSALELADC